MQEEILIEKIRALPPEKIAEVEDFIDFLWHKEGDRQLVEVAARLTESRLREVWDNPADAAYDKL
jgi:hypothetical protein